LTAIVKDTSLILTNISMAGEVVCDLCKLLFCGEILCDALDELGHQEEAVSVARVELGQVILYITSVAELGILY
jgi:hypothetical protein